MNEKKKEEKKKILYYSLIYNWWVKECVIKVMKFSL